MFKKRIKDFFIPHTENDYAPHSLQKSAMVGMLFLVILSFTLSNALSLLWMSSEWMLSTILPAVIVDLTNDERQVDTLRTLTRSAVLDQAATLKAQDMAKNQYFAHYSPQGISPWFWFGEVGYNFVHAGENLAIHFSDSGAVVDAWMKSPSHRDNIMNGNYSEIGIGTAEGKYEGYQTVYVVQLFGTPSAPVAIAPTGAVAGQATNIAEVESRADDEVLAESVAITEDVQVIEAEPEPIITEPTPVLMETEEVVEVVPPATEVAEMEATNNGVAVYSNFMATTTGGIPATIDATYSQDNSTAPFLIEFAVQPHKVLQVLYVIIGLFVLVALTLSVFIEIRRQQPLQIAYGVGLISLMFALFYIHTVLTAGALII